MIPFKFFKGQVSKFQHEITSSIYWSPASLMYLETWSTERSRYVKEWLNDFYINNCHPTLTHKYVPEIDRNLQIINWGMEYQNDHDLFNATIRIYRHINEYMELNVKYIIN